MSIFRKKKEVLNEIDNSHDLEVQKKVESHSSPETESIPESEPKTQTDQGETDQSSLNPAQPKEPTENQAVAKSNKSVRQGQIEQILEADLGEIYFQMDAQHQAMFKAGGEETAQKIDGLLIQAKVKSQQIFELIKSWLQLIPGINKWFVMQESKIKTDKIIRIKNEQ
jgi:hypothetical protein